MSPTLQSKLLRVLQEREFEPLGAERSEKVDLRVIAATNRDLRQMVADGKFQEDLFYRLNVIPVVVPPLRQRREDIPLLVERFVELLAIEMKRRIDGVSSDAMAALMAHDWPGNVRELRNVLERGAVVAPGAVIQLTDLGLPSKADAAPRAGTLASLEEVEKRHVAAVLAHTGGNVSQSARILGIDRVTLYNKMRKYAIRRDGEDGEPKTAERAAK
jgi:two-component system, NtrC family, response regulator AtoC